MFLSVLFQLPIPPHFLHQKANSEAELRENRRDFRAKKIFVFRLKLVINDDILTVLGN